MQEQHLKVFFFKVITIIKKLNAGGLHRTYTLVGECNLNYFFY